MKYKITVRATTERGIRQRTFIQESEKLANELCKEIKSDYDMFPRVHVEVQEVMKSE